MTWANVPVERNVIVGPMFHAYNDSRVGWLLLVVMIAFREIMRN